MHTVQSVLRHCLHGRVLALVQEVDHDLHTVQSVLRHCLHGRVLTLPQQGHDLHTVHLRREWSMICVACNQAS